MGVHDNDIHEINKNNIPDKDEEKLTFKKNKIAYIKQGIRKFLKIIWNPKKKQLLGNDGEDWAKTGAFYTIFYALLGGFTWAMIAIFMAITNARENPLFPVYVGYESVLSSTVVSPGMGVRPHVGTEKPSIIFSKTSYDIYKENLDLFLKPYKGSSYDTIFEYLESLNCSSDQNYGYNTLQPCVIVKINNVFTWTPNEEVLPECIKDLKINKTEKFVYIQCDGANSFKYQSPFNKDLFNSSSCPAGIPFTYYPYKNEPGYMQPLVAIKLNLTANVDHKVRCTAYAQNLNVNSRLGYGTIEFSIKYNE